jgi:hypothetical protein
LALGAEADRHGMCKGIITFPRTKSIKKCIEMLPLRDAAVSPPELFYLPKENRKGNGVEKPQ